MKLLLGRMCLRSICPCVFTLKYRSVVLKKDLRFGRTNQKRNDINHRPGEKTFLFVHQESWQRCLLKRYGDQLVLMDATYKTTKYAMPLFFICVHTNIGYNVVAEFMSQTEEKESINNIGYHEIVES